MRILWFILTALSIAVQPWAFVYIIPMVICTIAVYVRYLGKTVETKILILVECIFMVFSTVIAVLMRQPVLTRILLTLLLRGLFYITVIYHSNAYIFVQHDKVTKERY